MGAQCAQSRLAQALETFDIGLPNIRVSGEDESAQVAYQGSNPPWIRVSEDNLTIAYSLEQTAIRKKDSESLVFEEVEIRSDPLNYVAYLTS